MSKKENNSDQVNASVSISTEIHNYLKEYGKETTIRTVPNPNAPATHERLLRAIDLALGKKRGTSRISPIAGHYAKAAKYNASTYSTLANMSNVPFPLIEAGKAVDDNSDKIETYSLINGETNKPVGERYALVGLTELGKLVIRHHRGQPMSYKVRHKSFVPASLFMNSSPWTLGYKTQMLSLNPKELFQLQERMITLGTKDLPDEDVEKYFKGIDLGEDYIIRAKADSLFYLYGSGRGSFTVLPKIEIHNNNKFRAIIIKAPPVGSGSEYYAKIFKEYLTNLSTYQTTGKDFKSFSFDNYGVNGREFYLKNVRFYGTPEEIKNEIWNFKGIKQVYHPTNTMIDDETGKIDIKPIKETLWQHLQYEKEMVYKEYEEKLANAKTELSYALLLEKITRDGVRDRIGEFLNQRNRAKLLYEIFGEESTHEDKKKYMPNDCLTEAEIRIIYSQDERVMVRDKHINLLAILPYRDLYKDLWATIQREVAEIKDILNNPDKIMEIIRRDVVQLINNPIYNRKSDIAFLESDYYSHIDSNSHNFIPMSYNNLYDNYRMPVSIAYSSKVIYKYYGKNLNIPRHNPLQQGALNHVINCMNDEKLILVYNNGKSELVNVNKLNHVSYPNNELVGIIPFNNEYPQLVAIGKTEKIGDKEKVVKNRLHILPSGAGQIELKSNEFIIHSVSLDMSEYDCVSFKVRGFNGDEDNDGYIKVHKAKFIETTGPMYQSPVWGLVTDICESKTKDPMPLFKLYGTDGSTYPYSPANLSDKPTKLLSGEYSSHLSPNLEFYINNFYIENLEVFNILHTQIFRKEKKFVVPERTFKHKEDSKGFKVREKLINTYFSINKNKRPLGVLKAVDSIGYRKFKISDIDINYWSILDKDLGFPARKPNNEEDLRICDEFASKMFSGKLPAKVKLPITLIKEREEVKQQINYNDNKDKYKEYDYNKGEDQ